MKREFLQGLMEGMPKEVVDAIMEENGRDIQQAKQTAREWEERFNQAQQSHQTELAEMGFQAALGQEITAAGGRNHKAIAALLDLDALRASQDQTQAVKEALQALKKDSGYLFRQEQLPMYAVGTGATAPAPAKPETLAEALKEKFLKR